MVNTHPFFHSFSFVKRVHNHLYFCNNIWYLVRYVLSCTDLYIFSCLFTISWLFFTAKICLLINLIINKYCFMFSILLPTSKHKLHKYNPTATSLSWHTGVYKNKYIINNHGISVSELISVEMFNSSIILYCVFNHTITIISLQM